MLQRDELEQLFTTNDAKSMRRAMDQARLTIQQSEQFRESYFTEVDKSRVVAATAAGKRRKLQTFTLPCVSDISHVCANKYPGELN